MMAWSRLAMVRSGSGISAILSSAARSSAANPSNALPVVLLADLRVSFFAVLLSAIANHLLMPNEYQVLALPGHLGQLDEVAASVVRLGDGGARDLSWRHDELRPASLDALLVHLNVVGEEHRRRLALLELRLLVRLGRRIVVQRQL